MMTTRRDVLHLAAAGAAAAVPVGALALVATSALEALFVLYAEKEAELLRRIRIADQDLGDKAALAAQMQATDEMCAVAEAICAYPAKDAGELRTKCLWLLEYTKDTEMQANECEALLRSMV